MRTCDQTGGQGLTEQVLRRCEGFRVQGRELDRMLWGLDTARFCPVGDDLEHANSSRDMIKRDSLQLLSAPN